MEGGRFDADATSKDVGKFPLLSFMIIRRCCCLWLVIRLENNKSFHILGRFWERKGRRHSFFPGAGPRSFCFNWTSKVPCYLLSDRFFYVVEFKWGHLHVADKQHCCRPVSPCSTRVKEDSAAAQSLRLPINPKSRGRWTRMAFAPRCFNAVMTGDDYTPASFFYIARRLIARHTSPFLRVSHVETMASNLGSVFISTCYRFPFLTKKHIFPPWIKKKFFFHSVGGGGRARKESSITCCMAVAAPPVGSSYIFFSFSILLCVRRDVM